MNMMTTVMCPDAFPVEKVQLAGWSGERDHTRELKTVTQATLRLGGREGWRQPPGWFLGALASSMSQ